MKNIFFKGFILSVICFSFIGCNQPTLVVKAEKIDYDKDSSVNFTLTGVTSISLKNSGTLTDKNITEEEGFTVFRMDNGATVTVDCKCTTSTSGSVGSCDENVDIFTGTATCDRAGCSNCTMSVTTENLRVQFIEVAIQ